MRIRRVLLGLAIFILATGLFLFASATVRETHSSSRGGALSWPVSGDKFGFFEQTLTPDNPPRLIIGTSGMADLIILKTPVWDFDSYVCHQVPIPTPANGDCAGVDFLRENMTILNSYLRTPQSQIAYSQTIVGQNVTLDYRVPVPTNVTIVLAQLGSGTSTDYFSRTVTNTTLTYPILGYTERGGTAWNLSNISLAVTAIGGIGLAATLVRFKPIPLNYARSYPGPAFQKCPACGHESLFFAEKCLHCGNILRSETRVETPWHRS